MKKRGTGDTQTAPTTGDAWMRVPGAGKKKIDSVREKPASGGAFQCLRERQHRPVQRGGQPALAEAVHDDLIPCHEIAADLPGRDAGSRDRLDETSVETVQPELIDPAGHEWAQVV